MLQVELELVFVQDGDIGAQEGGLVVFKALAKVGDVLVRVPWRKLGVLELFLGLDVKGTPCCIEMLEDLEGGGVAVGGVAVLELGVELLVKRVRKVDCDSLEETFANVPTRLHTFPLFFKAFLRVGGSEVGYTRVVAGWFGLFNIH